MAKTEKTKKEPILKTIIIGKPRSDLTKKIANDPDVEIVNPNISVTSFLKKYGSDKNLFVYSHGFLFHVDIRGWFNESLLNNFSKRSY